MRTERLSVSPGRRKSRAGFTLVMALAALALMAVLLLALLQGASHQIHGAESEASIAREKMAADTAVALVIGQIRHASTQPGQAWISQPGLLRTYDTSGSRQPLASYKLYSSEQMIDRSGTLDFLGGEIPADWNSAENRSRYTDLNAPVQTPGLAGQSIYPILDPAAFSSVQGMSVDSDHSVEMPVAWLYQLQDGTLGSASRGTKANPIVARLAFWTDDETSKININTAGCGSPWNMPRSNSAGDVAAAEMQPARGEYSRYPGHPATTSLEPVFGLAADVASLEKLLDLAPRYAAGGSLFGTKTTVPNQVLPPKTARLYASLDELCFAAGLSESGGREASLVSPDQINTARFVLTAHSEAPETTVLGEPRIALWPVSDQTDSAHETAVDRAVAQAATAGGEPYYFQRHNALSAKDDLDPAIVPGNARLFRELLDRGDADLPGSGSHFTKKYPGASWAQLQLEIVDFIRGLNAVDPAPAPFVPYAAGDASGVGRGLVMPLSQSYPGLSVPLRGLGRYPTLSSLTLVFYVCGFGFKDGSFIDYDMTPDEDGANWEVNFAPDAPTNRWGEVTSELVRAFVVPCTFQPGCGYPETSDACDIQITGLDRLTVGSDDQVGDFGFPAEATSRLLSDAQRVLPVERAWGGNEGPLAWRAAALDAVSAAAPYAFAGTKPFAVPMTTTSAEALNPKSARRLHRAWPPTKALHFTGLGGLTVSIRDAHGKVVQTFQADLPPATKTVPYALQAPTINGECDHRDGDTPGTSSADWADAANTATRVPPSYYMSLRHRLLATQRSRPVMIQAGDISLEVEAATDLRVIAGLSSVPASMFHPHPQYQLGVVNAQGGTHAHNFRFADGTSACFASGYNYLAASATPPSRTGNISSTDWVDGTSAIAYPWAASPACSTPTTKVRASVFMATNVYGDWDAGPGFAPDGAQINLPDGGTELDSTQAYFSLTGGKIGAATQRTPDALVASPVALGSLPAGINPAAPDQSQPWRTLLFCPYPAAGDLHPGLANPPDHLLLDNFWMPVVEPYPISTCLTTAGKINLNNKIAPFTWLHRRTAFLALLRDLRVPVLSTVVAGTYKTPAHPAPDSIWKAVDEEATIAAIENHDTKIGAFLSESEICTVPIVPVDPRGVAASDPMAFWSRPTGAGWMTGDNLRELPYAQLYSRLTTRSNSYTVHVRVQVLQKKPGDPRQDVWNEDSDLILGDWRGSYEIERYLDSANVTNTRPLGPYRFRIVSARRFTP